MRALVHDPAGPSGIRSEDVPAPTTGPSQALIEVAADSLDFGKVDAFVVGDRFGQDIPSPLSSISERRLVASIGFCTSWERTDEAFDARLGRRVAGKAVLDIARGR
jgi:hypothetical protein